MPYRHFLPDGTKVTTQTAGQMATVLDIERQQRLNHKDYIEWLRGLGCKAAHPDDGWVNRNLDRIHLEYPYFNDGLKAGDWLALGFFYRPENTRICLVTYVQHIGRLIPMTYYYFKQLAPPPERCDICALR